MTSSEQERLSVLETQNDNVMDKINGIEKKIDTIESKIDDFH